MSKLCSSYTQPSRGRGNPKGLRRLSMRQHCWGRNLGRAAHGESTAGGRRGQAGKGNPKELSKNILLWMG